MATPGTPPIPHVGGPIMPPCAVRVITGGMPQARVGDMCVCVGPPDSIVKGAFTVLVSGQPAARLGDNTAHGGVIVVGFPTVMIGESGGGGGGGGGFGTFVGTMGVEGQGVAPAEMADAMIGAAKTGKPFCEVCMKG